MTDSGCIDDREDGSTLYYGVGPRDRRGTEIAWSLEGVDSGKLEI